MDLSLRPLAYLVLLFLASSSSFVAAHVVTASVVFPVQHKFKGQGRNLSAFKAHDVRRHGRLLYDVDLILGGNGKPSETGLYFANIGIGSPSKDYYVQVDTGSDILWVNCIGCVRCPKKSNLGIELTLYDPKSSSTSSLVTCEQDFCKSTYDGPLPGCRPDLLCQYSVVYGDGSATTGYFVEDIVQLDRVTGDHEVAPENGSVIFGCGAKQSGELGSSSEALDGILGFGQANSSMISQLALAGKVKKMFAHCLDNSDGGGIFAIGQVVQPNVNMTALVPNQAHYNVVLKDIEVGGEALSLPSDIFDNGFHKGTIIDSGTTLAYLPEVVYETLIPKIMAQQPGLKSHIIEDQFTCFQYIGNIDDGFPTVAFHFEDSLSLTVYPHEYLFQIRVRVHCQINRGFSPLSSTLTSCAMDDVWCIGWQNSGMSKDGSQMTLLGDLVLSNKLVVYDLVKQAIGWTEYNCSSSIKVKDASGAVYSVYAHNISSASTVIIRRTLTFMLLLLIGMLHSFSY